MAAAVLGVGVFASPVPAQQPPERGAAARPVTLSANLAGRPVEQIRILGNETVPDEVIRNQIRTRVGEPFDPITVQEDYQRVFGLRKFANVQASVEPTAEGVVVIYRVAEQDVIGSVEVVGNFGVTTEKIRGVIGVGPGEAIDDFRIALAKRNILDLYRASNYPLARVEVDQALLRDRRALRFVVIEGPNVRVRNIDFLGNDTFSEDRLKRQIGTKIWIFVFRSGLFSEQQLEDDVASLKQFYISKGFFDVRVGRRVVFSPDQTEVEIEFLIDEGPQYTVEAVRFIGNEALTEQQLRELVRLQPGMAWDSDRIERDVQEILEAYGPFGFIYQPRSNDPDYLRISPEPVFRLEPGRVELVYRISEGKPFNVGNVLVRGNTRSREKVVLRELRLAPGELYNSATLRDGARRLQGLPLFDDVRVTPVGNDPDERDILVEVEEARTAFFNIGGGINSNGGVGASFTYVQRNFDIANPPSPPWAIWEQGAYIGNGQTFRLSFEPGTEATNASISFTDPYVFDTRFSVSTSAFFRQRERLEYDDRRLGGALAVGRRFDDVWSAQVSFRAEEVLIDNIDDEPIRAFELLALEGTSFLTSVGASVRRDTTNPGRILEEGSVTTLGVEGFGLLGGDYDFQRITGTYDHYTTLSEDLLDRPTILAWRNEIGAIVGDAPIFERFYAGGIGSVRGFSFRGISPRSGPADDRIGGDFTALTSVELSFPVLGDELRGVVFTDIGTVEEDYAVGTIRSAVGAGIRLNLPVFGNVPVAVDLALPITKDDDDDTSVISFSFGL